MSRCFTASLTLAALLGAVITFEVGGALPMVVAVSMFVGFGLCAIVGAAATVEG